MALALFSVHTFDISHIFSVSKLPVKKNNIFFYYFIDNLIVFVFNNGKWITKCFLGRYIFQFKNQIKILTLSIDYFEVKNLFVYDSNFILKFFKCRCRYGKEI